MPTDNDDHQRAHPVTGLDTAVREADELHSQLQQERQDGGEVPEDEIEQLANGIMATVREHNDRLAEQAYQEDA